MDNLCLTLFTPTYNRDDKLYRVFNSIMNQTLKKIDGKYIFEWIIVDDGSKDDTKTLVESWKNEVDFSIRYLYQENQGKPAASRKGIERAKGELFLFADSDDEFLNETFETFYNIWNDFSKDEKEKCGGIGVLCQDQYGKRIGSDYPITHKLFPSLETVFGWRDIGLGETWAVLKTKNLKKAFVIPDVAKHLKFIPESFFWSRIVFEIQPYSYFINKVLRIYYKDEGENISQNIRDKYPEGFLFESKWFITKYYKIAFKYPKVYFKHLLKLIYFYLKVKSMDCKKVAPLFGKDKKEPRYYKNIRMKTDTCLHEQLVEYISKISKNKKLKILDWGCGEGALSQRLVDLGHEVFAVDMDAESFKANCQFIQINFNNKNEVEKFLEKKYDFDIVLGIEVIEHVKSPYEYLEYIKKLCDYKTIAIVSTPNIASWWGRFWFLLKGELWGFSYESWDDPGHINPISDIEMKRILEEKKLELIDTFEGGLLPVIWFYNFKRLLISLFMLPFRFIMKGRKDGWVVVYVFKKG